jgi:threonine synthase
MGLPIELLVIGSNQNDILPRTLATSIYEMRGVVETSSPSMDIQISSNFERYLFEASGRDAELVSRQMQMLTQGRRFELTDAQATAMGRDYAAGAASEADVAATIRDTLSASGYLLDPHTACGVYAAKTVMTDRISHDVPRVVLATAHPAKFPDAMDRITGQRPGLPARLASLMTDDERYPVLNNDLKDIQTYVERVSRAAGAPA